MVRPKAVLEFDVARKFFGELVPSAAVSQAYH
jgi:hypothetical protein